MSIAECLYFVLLVLTGDGLLLWESRLDERDRRQQESTTSSPVETEVETMRRAAELRDLTRAAEAHMDEFIANRAGEQQVAQPNVVDGEVVQVQDDRCDRRWRQ